MSVYTSPTVSGVSPYGSPQILAQIGVPLILAPNGTVATNGTITLGTALPATFSGGAWIVLPANAIVGGAAGLYWCIFSSTTVGVVKTNFNSAASAFTPGIPVGTLVTATGSNAAYTQTTSSALNLCNVIVPGGAMGLTGSVRITSQWSVPNNANAKFAGTNLGGTSIGLANIASVIASREQRQVVNRGVANSQVTFPGGTGFGTSAGTATTYPAKDTSVDQAITLTANSAVATDYIILETVLIEVIPT